MPYNGDGQRVFYFALGVIFFLGLIFIFIGSVNVPPPPQHLQFLSPITEILAFIKKNLHEFAVALGHGFIIATILGITVDRYIKIFLAKDIATLVIGYPLPEEIRRKMIDLMSSYPVIRQNFSVLYQIKRQNNNEVEVTVTQWFTVMNYSSKDQPFQHDVELDSLPKKDVSFELLSCDSKDKTAQYIYPDQNTHIAPNYVNGNMVVSGK